MNRRVGVPHVFQIRREYLSESAVLQHIAGARICGSHIFIADIYTDMGQKKGTYLHGTFIIQVCAGSCRAAVNVNVHCGKQTQQYNYGKEVERSYILWRYRLKGNSFSRLAGI